MQATVQQPHRAPDGAPVHYERHRPEQTTLYRQVPQHAATFFAQAEAGCKRCGFCLSCGARRMAQTAAHLVDHVISHVPVRQWVLSLPLPLHAAACTCRIAFCPRAGQKELTVQGAMPREKDFKKTLCADIDGVSLNAAMRCGGDDRQALERLCRYITRPALANECVQTNAAGQVVLRLKTPWRAGTTHLVMSPLEFMQRLTALVPRPRLHLVRFDGVLALNAKLRAQVVP